MGGQPRLLDFCYRNQFRLWRIRDHNSSVLWHNKRLLQKLVVLTDLLRNTYVVQNYDLQRTWQWNLDHSPRATDATSQSALPGPWTWCGLPVSSPLGIPAGPLLNSGWLLQYANLGFDVLVYKTVRSTQRDCYPLPNLVPVTASQLSTAGTVVRESPAMNGSWAVSFGMPSQKPDVWRKDVEFTKTQLPPDKVLVVSIVGTQDESITDGQASLEHLANDFALCAEWAMQSGADGVEANFSCPNVSTADGQLFQQPESAGFVAERIRDRIGKAPLVLKIGRVASLDEADTLLQYVSPYVNGLAMTNSIAARVADADGDLLFDGHARGICGAATRDASISQVALFRESLINSQLRLDLIGVGGISTAQHVRDYLSAGASSVALATSAMIDPMVGLAIREQLAEE